MFIWVYVFVTLHQIQPTIAPNCFADQHRITAMLYCSLQFFHIKFLFTEFPNPSSTTVRNKKRKSGLIRKYDSVSKCLFAISFVQSFLHLMLADQKTVFLLATLLWQLSLWRYLIAIVRLTWTHSTLSEVLQWGLFYSTLLLTKQRVLSEGFGRSDMSHYTLADVSIPWLAPVPVADKITHYILEVVSVRRGIQL